MTATAASEVGTARLRLVFIGYPDMADNLPRAAGVAELTWAHPVTTETLESWWETGVIRPADENETVIVYAAADSGAPVDDPPECTVRYDHPPLDSAALASPMGVADWLELPEPPSEATIDPVDLPPPGEYSDPPSSPTRVFGDAGSGRTGRRHRRPAQRRIGARPVIWAALAAVVAVQLVAGIFLLASGKTPAPAPKPARVVSTVSKVSTVMVTMPPKLIRSTVVTTAVSTAVKTVVSTAVTTTVSTTTVRPPAAKSSTATQSTAQRQGTLGVQQQPPPSR